MNYYKIFTFLLLSIATHGSIYYAAMHNYKQILIEKNEEIEDIQKDFMTMVKQRDIAHESAKMNENTIKGYIQILEETKQRHKEEIEYLTTQISHIENESRNLHHKTLIHMQNATEKVQEEYNKGFFHKCGERAVEALTITALIGGISKIGSLTYSYLS